MASGNAVKYTCTLDEATLDKAKEELKEDPDTRLLEIKTLADRLLQYPGLKPNTDPNFLIKFLRARKFDQERAFKLILNYYMMRKEDPDIFAGLKPSNVAHVYQSNIGYPHSHRDREGRTVYLVFPARHDMSRYKMIDVFKTEFLNLNKMIQEEENQVRGFTILLDYKDFGMAKFLDLNMDFGKRMSRLWQDNFPARMKNCLIVNEPHFMDMCLALFTPFLKQKLVSRIHRIGTDWKRLHDFIDPACLPECYGGTLPEETCPKKWMNQMLQSDREMEEESKYGFVEFTMEQKNKNENAITNMAGTFKQLNV